MIKLRSEPTDLSKSDAAEMIRKFGFFDGLLNPAGLGFKHKYKAINFGLIIFDETTGLMWQQSGFKNLIKFEKAEDYIDNLNQVTFVGYSDWRLPTLEEAMSLMEPVKSNNLYINPVFDNTQYLICTSDLVLDELVLGERLHWGLDFVDGSCYNSSICNFISTDVRAVRSSQSSPGKNN